MPIRKITSPSEVPASVDDYTQQNALTQALLLAAQGAQRIVGSNVAKDAIFYVGGTTYKADADTAISGTASDYVKLTPSVDGLTLAPSYVADLTGVTWSSTYNGYYDASGNLYVFDELKALSLGTITTAKLREVGLKNLAGGWATALITALGAGWTTILAKTIIDFSVGAAGDYHDDDTLSGATWVIPAGMYIFSPANADVVLQIKDGTTNWNGAGPLSGIVISDGVNFRLYNNSGASRHVYYRKLL